MYYNIGDIPYCVIYLNIYQLLVLSVTGKKPSWKCPLDQKIRILIRKKSRLWNRYIETKNPQIHKEYKKLRNEVRKQTRLAVRKEQCEVAKQSSLSLTPKSFGNMSTVSPSHKPVSVI